MLAAGTEQRTETAEAREDLERLNRWIESMLGDPEEDARPGLRAERRGAAGRRRAGAPWHERSRAADQLALDVAEIARARDALLAARGAAANPTALGEFPPPLRRTAETVPVILGSILGVLMLAVFSTAAMFMNFAR